MYYRHSFYRKSLIFVFLISFLLFLFTYSQAGVLSGTVVRVLDGDTIIVRPLNQKNLGHIIVRLAGIDAPEKTQKFGQEAKKCLENLVLNQNVIIKYSDTHYSDRYGRLVGYVFINNKNINLELVRLGCAWSYEKYLERPYISQFYEAEKEARKSQKGLWQDPNPIPPWEYRQLKRQKNK